MFHIYSRTLCHLSLSNSTLHSPILLFSDYSLSSLVSLAKYVLTQPIVQRIQILCHSLSLSDAPVFLIRIPGHSNIPGNENIDTAAKNPPPPAEPSLLSYVPIQKKYLHSKILNLWQNQWSLTSSKLLPLTQCTISTPIYLSHMIPRNTPFSPPH